MDISKKHMLGRCANVHVNFLLAVSGGHSRPAETASKNTAVAGILI